MPELQVMMVSTPFAPGDPVANLARVAEIVGSRAGSQPDLYIFGEANLNGGFWKGGHAEYGALGEDVPDGPTCQAAIRLARAHQVTLCVGLLERAPGGWSYITHILCGPGGYIGRQRKMFCNNARVQRFSDGDEGIAAFEVCGHRCCILARADLLFPEPVLLAAALDPALLIAPIDAFDVAYRPMLQRVLVARAWDASAHAVAVFGHDSAGESATVMAMAAASPHGQVLVCQTRDAGTALLTPISLQLAPPRRRRGRWANPADRLARIGTHAMPLV